jgi:hypothetical protein
MEGKGVSKVVGLTTMGESKKGLEEGVQIIREDWRLVELPHNRGFGILNCRGIGTATSKGDGSLISKATGGLFNRRTGIQVRKEGGLGVNLKTPAKGLKGAVWSPMKVCVRATLLTSSVIDA